MEKDRKASTSSLPRATSQSDPCLPFNSYPELAKEHTHLTKAYVPSDILVALKQDPSLVQKAVEAFYTRDGIQLRVRFRLVPSAVYR